MNVIYIWSKLGGKKSLTVGCVKLAFHFKPKGWININASYTVHVKETSNENEGKLMIIQDEFPVYFEQFPFTTSIESKKGQQMRI